ncbi:hypothetical protein [Spongiimicrobium sp. 2-473A-2-J]|uniref:hypothetical protein n=1 Tax=Eudoraea algarum TaxID=3417568 RepID=UPI003D369536
MSDLPIPYIIGYFVYGLGQLLVLIGCFILFFKQRSLASILMLLGSILSIILGIIGVVLPMVMARTGGPEAIVRSQGIISVVNGMVYIMFATGLILLAIKLVKKNENPSI